MLHVQRCMPAVQLAYHVHASAPPDFGKPPGGSHGTRLGRVCLGRDFRRPWQPPVTRLGLGSDSESAAGPILHAAGCAGSAHTGSGSGPGPRRRAAASWLARGGEWCEPAAPRKGRSRAAWAVPSLKLPMELPHDPPLSGMRLCYYCSMRRMPHSMALSECKHEVPHLPAPCLKLAAARPWVLDLNAHVR